MQNILLSDQLDLNSLYRNGYAVTYLKDEYIDPIKEAVLGYDYMSDKDHNPDTATWEKTETGLPHDIEAPDELDAFCKTLSRSPYFQWPRIVYGEFSKRNVMLQRCAKHQSMRWHWDVFDSMPLVNMIYFTEGEFQPDDGGQLEIGRCQVTPEGIIDYDNPIEKVASILPEDGKVVTIDNRNPTFSHRVVENLSDKVRYTLICQFGYIENVMKSRVKDFVDHW